jgi:hypothetical protein
MPCKVDVLEEYAHILSLDTVSLEKVSPKNVPWLLQNTVTFRNIPTGGIQLEMMLGRDAITARRRSQQ